MDLLMHFWTLLSNWSILHFYFWRKKMLCIIKWITGKKHLTKAQSKRILQQIYLNIHKDHIILFKNCLISKNLHQIYCSEKNSIIWTINSSRFYFVVVSAFKYKSFDHNLRKCDHNWCSILGWKKKLPPLNHLL